MNQTCSFCGEVAEGNYSIHVSPTMEGEEVPLCDECGGSPTPTCEEIWQKLAKSGGAGPVPPQAG